MQNFNPPPDFTGRYFCTPSGVIYYAVKGGTYIDYGASTALYGSRIEVFSQSHGCPILTAKEYYIKKFKELYGK